MNDYNKLHKMVNSFSKLADEDLDAYEMDQQWQREHMQEVKGELRELETSFDAMKAAASQFLDTFDKIDGEPDIRSDRSVEARSTMWTSLNRMRELYAELVAELDPGSGE